jgi:D-proline reductase (dithiol) PrdB
MTTFPFYPPDRAGEFERFAAEYQFVQGEPTPWTPLRRELRHSKAALVTTAGLRLKTQQSYGRPSAEFREISIYASPEDLAFDFTNYDPAEAEKDLNVIVPVDRMKELVDRGQLGGLGETFLSFFGLCPDLEALRRSAARAGEKLRGYGCDAAFVFPANHVCNQTAGIIARELERQGLSTVAAVTIKEVAQQVRLPRAVFINFPFGRTLGRAGEAALQASIVADMARALRTHERPGKIVDLPYKWQGPVE